MPSYVARKEVVRSNILCLDQSHGYRETPAHGKHILASQAFSACRFSASILPANSVLFSLHILLSFVMGGPTHRAFMLGRFIQPWREPLYARLSAIVVKLSSRNQSSSCWLFSCYLALLLQGCASGIGQTQLPHLFGMSLVLYLAMNQPDCAVQFLLIQLYRLI